MSRLTPGLLDVLSKRYAIPPLGMLVSDLKTVYFGVDPIIGSVRVPTTESTIWYVTDTGEGLFRLGPVNHPSRRQFVIYADLPASSESEATLAARLAQAMRLEEIDFALASYLQRQEPHNDR